MAYISEANQATRIIPEIYRRARERVADFLLPSSSTQTVLAYSAQRARGFQYCLKGADPPPDALMHNSCWLATSIQLLAVDVTLFQLAQQIHLLGGGGFRTQHRVFDNDAARLEARQVAELVVACGTNTTQDQHVRDVYHKLLVTFNNDDLLDENSYGSLQMRYFESLLVGACAEIDPTYAPLHRAITQGPAHLEFSKSTSLTAGIQEAMGNRALEHAHSYITVQRAGTALTNPLFYDPNDVPILYKDGTALRYRVVGGVHKPTPGHFVAFVPGDRGKMVCRDNLDGSDHGDSIKPSTYLPIDKAYSPCDGTITHVLLQLVQN